MNVNQKLYEVEVVSLNESDSDVTNICYEASRIEYEYNMHRMDKLDNKVYILITVCAFLFAKLCEELKDFWKIEFPFDIYKFAIFVCSKLLMVSALVIFLVLIVFLLILLKSITVPRFKISKILEKDMLSENSYRVAKCICWMYEECNKKNNAILQRRFDDINICTHLMVAEIIVIILIAFIQN